MKAFLVLLLFSSACCAQVFPDTGKPAPEVQLQPFAQASGMVQPKLEALRGKPVVLEFWATWCGGCVAAIPHLNELAEQFKDKVVFVSVTDEEPELVKAFLKRKPIAGLMGIDRDGATFKTYGVEGRPQAFLIDAAGVLRGSVALSRLDAALMEKFLEGKPLGDAVQLNRPVWPVLERQPGTPPPLLQCIIRPAAPSAVSGYSPGAFMSAEGGRREMYGVSIQRMLENQGQMRNDRITAPAWTDTVKFDVSTVVPQGRKEDYFNLLFSMMTITFQMKSHREMRPVEVYVLRKAPDAAARLRVSLEKPTDGFRPAPGHITGVATGIAALMRRMPVDSAGLEPAERVEVLDETGLMGVYDFDLVWKRDDVASLIAALHDQLGITMTREMRQREFFVIDSAVEPTTW